MLSKETFCKALRMIKEQEEIDEKFDHALDLVCDGHCVYGTKNKFLCAGHNRQRYRLLLHLPDHFDCSV